MSVEVVGSIVYLIMFVLRTMQIGEQNTYLHRTNEGDEFKKCPCLCRRPALTLYPCAWAIAS